MVKGKEGGWAAADEVYEGECTGDGDGEKGEAVFDWQGLRWI